LKGNEPRGTIVSKANIAKVNTSWYSQITDRYLTEITDTDTFLLDPPLIIQSRHDLSKIKPTIYGPLLIDGAHIGITWRDTGTYIIKGDFQITGEVEIEGITFVVAGEIKMLDNAILKNCNLFTQSRLFIGDFAQFEGSALAMHSITVYGKSTVSGKSSLIAGSSSSSDNTNKTSDSLKFSILLSEESIVDAVCIALSTPGSIKTDEATKITGILWAQHIVCHRGEMSGLICADRVVDCNDPEQMATSETASQMNTLGDSTGNKKDKHLQPIELTNVIPGYIEPLPEINLYSLPFFLGRLSIVAWKEE
jgi:hypothetical protein